MSGELVPFPPSSATRSVPISGERPTQEWIVVTVMAMLSMYYQPDEDEDILRLQMAFWRDALSDVPKAALELAIRDRMRSSSRSRPIPGEIRELALKHCRNDLRLEKKPEDRPFGPMHPPLTDDERERCTAMLDELRRHLGVTLDMRKVERPMARIIRVTGEVCGVTAAQIRGKIKLGNICKGRLLAYRACRVHTASTFAEIGAACGGKDHGTVISGINQADAKIASDPGWAESAAEIDRRLGE